MYIDSLVGKRSIPSVRRALDGLKTPPQETKDRSDVLSKAYHKAMERIQQQKGDLPADAMTILAWVVKSKKPLPVGTLRLILAIDTKKCMVDEDNFPTADHITQACAPLVVIESKSQEARLAHYTIQEYFERSNNTWMEKSQELIANTCMSYLSFSTIHSVFWNTSDDDGRFHKYATQFWAHHTAEALAQGLENQRVEQFLHNRTNSDLWHDCLMQIDLARTNFSASELGDLLQISEQVIELHVAACLGLSSIVAELINKGCDPDVRDKRNRSPLWWAVYNGHAGIVELLLEQNVDTEVKDTFSYRTPLKLAAERGLVSVVRLLLDKDADLQPGNRDETYGGITAWDVNVRLIKVNEMFQPYGTGATEIFEGNWWYLSPLALAAKQGHEDISALLLRRGAKIEAKSDYGPTISALNVAITANQKSIVRLLLTHGADVEMRDVEGSTALHIAVRYAQTNIVELLLAHGADTEVQDKDGRTALQIAINFRRPNTAKLLLLHGANIKARDNKGLTALHIAAERNNDDSVQFLLTHGAHIETRDNNGCTPLHLAAQSNKPRAIEVLLTHGGDIEARNIYGRTPLIVASGSRSQEAADLLMAQGADLAVHDNFGRSVLYRAIESRLWSTAEQLVTKGFNLEDGEAIVCDEMLHSAITHKSTVLVDILLNYRVNVNLSYKIDVNYPGWSISERVWAGTALHKAVASGCVAIVSRLLEVDGIDIEAKNSKGYDTFTMAIHGGKKEIARLLWATGKVRPEPGYERFFEFLTRSYI